LYICCFVHCHLEEFSKSPEASEKSQQEKKKESTERYDPQRGLTEKEAEQLLRKKGDQTDLDLSFYKKIDTRALEIIALYFKGKSINLDGLTEITKTDARALARFKGEKISLRGVKFGYRTDMPTLEHLSYFGGEIVNRSIVEYEHGKAFFDHSTGEYYLMSTSEQIHPDEKKHLLGIFSELSYNFIGPNVIGAGRAELKSRKKFIEEATWIANKYKTSPLVIKWEEIFPKGSMIEFTGEEEIDAETFNTNLKVLEKVETWITENIKGL